MPDLFPAPPKFNLFASLGADIVLHFNNKVPDSDPVEYVDFPAGTTVTLMVGRGDSQIVAPGVISGSTAVCTIQSEMADTIKPKTLWRCVVTDASGYDAVPLNGIMVRSDGA